MRRVTNEVVLFSTPPTLDDLFFISRSAIFSRVRRILMSHLFISSPSGLYSSRTPTMVANNRLFMLRFVYLIDFGTDCDNICSKHNIPYVHTHTLLHVICIANVQLTEMFRAWEEPTFTPLRRCLGNKIRRPLHTPQTITKL